ncbi:DJ-1/PfpI family protein [Nocardia fluminea]|uniref:DJ-1/PfpI family protein n=1 Tax=Nocardia fluminea TaxID=134984 RepID=UPI0033FED54D
MTSYGVLLYEGVEELDFVGPWEVFAVSSLLRKGADQAVLIAERPEPLRCINAMRVLPDCTFDDHPDLDVLLVPGGSGSRAQVGNPVLIDWIARTSKQVSWTAGVCTGTFLLHKAGVASGRRVTTHRLFHDTLQARGEVTVVTDARYVVDGDLITSQGISAGIDMALWLIGALHGRDHARRVREHMQYEPAPPYLADEPMAT